MKNLDTLILEKYDGFRAFAEATGQTDRNLLYIRCGERYPRHELFVRMANALGVSESAFFEVLQKIFAKSSEKA